MPRMIAIMIGIISMMILVGFPIIFVIEYMKEEKYENGQRRVYKEIF